MKITIEQATRQGASAGLLAEGEPTGFENWPAEARTAFHEQYAKGRFCRRVAEGKAKPLSHEPPPHSPYADMSRQDLIAAYRSSADLQREFGSSDVFVAYAAAAQQGRARIIGGKVVS
jgi:hypothetical protein